MITKRQMLTLAALCSAIASGQAADWMQFVRFGLCSASSAFSAYEFWYNIILCMLLVAGWETHLDTTVRWYVHMERVSFFFVCFQASAF